MRRIVIPLALAVAGCGGSSGTRGFNAPAVTNAETSPPEAPVASTAREAGKKPDQVGLATWYGPGFAGKKTSSGERFDPKAMTAAHRKLPFNTWVEVRRIDTGGVVRVRITDRGPWGKEQYIIDLSRAAADRLGIVQAGSAKVELRIVDGPE